MSVDPSSFSFSTPHVEIRGIDSLFPCQTEVYRIFLLRGSLSRFIFFPSVESNIYEVLNY